MSEISTPLKVKSERGRWLYEAIRQRALIRQRLVKLYAKYRVETSARTKLEKQIMQEYVQRYVRAGGVKRP